MSASYNFSTNKQAIENRIAALYKQIAALDRIISRLTNTIQNHLQAKNKILAEIKSLEDSINTPNNPTPPATSFAQMVLNVHNSMMNYYNKDLVNTSENNNFIVPFIPTNYNFKLEKTFPTDGGFSGGGSLENYKICYFPTLGNAYAGPGISPGVISYIEIFGYFSNVRANQLITRTTPAQTIISNTKYIVKKVKFPPNSLFQTPITFDINNNNLLPIIRGPFSSSVVFIQRVVNYLNQWASDTAFLCPPVLCETYYDNRYDDGIMPPGEIVYSRDRWNSAVPQIPTASSKANNIVLPNSLQKEYYDRLYEFMQVKGYNKSNSAETVISLLKNFKPWFIHLAPGENIR